eukprot:CAMPEP_0178898588 /NCGR_PEP_ID=MMETSP0786-20121207/2422_1 /TAXON_ID=186022 /ORGANISM="Thalassionema frauenfeldii, Strain CCMP 1798" /LENGTH=301 /DNA_ID=CAMNT_0020569339 /DNA_START=129 /DNA_END=1034 /DNA_ORIENTATION=+
MKVPIPRRYHALRSKEERLKYVHGYRAGNYADVVKHSVLIILLNKMTEKKSPFLYVDTHAGNGWYPLDESNKEFPYGIGKLLENIDYDLSETNIRTDAVGSLIQLVKTQKREKEASLIYPGSTIIAKSFCRPQDSLLLFEKFNDQFDTLTKNIQGEEDKIMIENDDGYQALATYAKQTPNLPRGLVFCDPPYQYGSDTDQAVRLVQHLAIHWRSARFALWFPASSDLKQKTKRLTSMMKAASDNVLCLEMYPSNHQRKVIGTGMLLVNPPYGIQNDIQKVLYELAELLGPENKPIIRLEEV